MVDGVELRPQFIDSTAGPLFAALYTPDASVAAAAASGHARKKTVVLLLPPFAEELNKSRRQINLQARRWCQSGVSVAVVDLLGTGDSAEDFSAATVEAWHAGILSAIEWLHGLGYRTLIPWAVRYGALLLNTAFTQSIMPVNSVVLWQPVTQGKQALMQLLRIEAMAGIDSDGPKTTTADLQAELKAGKVVEAGGYPINPALAEQLEQQTLGDCALSNGIRAEIFHVGANAEAAPPPALKKLEQRWQEEGASVNLHVVGGAKFWTTVEISSNEDLLAHSTVRLSLGDPND